MAPTPQTKKDINDVTKQVTQHHTALTAQIQQPTANMDMTTMMATMNQLIASQRTLSLMYENHIMYTKESPHPFPNGGPSLDATQQQVRRMQQDRQLTQLSVGAQVAALQRERSKPVQTIQQIVADMQTQRFPGGALLPNPSRLTNPSVNSKLTQAEKNFVAAQREADAATVRADEKIRHATAVAKAQETYGKVELSIAMTEEGRAELNKTAQLANETKVAVIGAVESMVRAGATAAQLGSAIVSL